MGPETPDPWGPTASLSSLLGGLKTQGMSWPSQAPWDEWGTSWGKEPLGKGWILNLTLANTISAQFINLSSLSFLSANRATIQLPQALPHRRESGLDQRKWFFPILCPRLRSSSYRGDPPDVCSSCFYALRDVSSLFSSSTFPFWLISSEFAWHALDLLQDSAEASESHFQAVGFQAAKGPAQFEDFSFVLWALHSSDFLHISFWICFAFLQVF